MSHLAPQQLEIDASIDAFEADSTPAAFIDAASHFYSLDSVDRWASFATPEQNVRMLTLVRGLAIATIGQVGKNKVQQRLTNRAMSLFERIPYMSGSERITKKHDMRGKLKTTTDEYVSGARTIGYAAYNLSIASLSEPEDYDERGALGRPTLALHAQTVNGGPIEIGLHYNPRLSVHRNSQGILIASNRPVQASTEYRVPVDAKDPVADKFRKLADAASADLTLLGR